MERLNNNINKTPKITTCLLDTDVIINWLSQEVESTTGKELWKSPHQIIKLIEHNKSKGFISLAHLLEVRFILRRKRGFSEERIGLDIEKILEVLEVAIPDEVDLLQANNLQSKNPLSPFDALLIALALSLKEVVLISRDKALLSLAAKFTPVATPEVFLGNLSQE